MNRGNTERSLLWWWAAFLSVAIFLPRFTASVDLPPQHEGPSSFPDLIEEHQGSVVFRNVHPGHISPRSGPETIATIEPKYRTPITVKALYDAIDCNNTHYQLNDDEGYLLYPLSTPDSYSCRQSFNATNSDSVLWLDCHSLALRFGCQQESLQIVTESTDLKLCGDTKLPRISGKRISINYTRNIYGLHGNYMCTVITQSKSSPISSSSFINCWNCGRTSAGEATRIADVDTAEPSDPHLARQHFKPRIVGGEITKEHEYPWMTYLELITEDASFACGGTLISDRVVVTAAHCLDATGLKEIKVYLGLQLLKNKQNSYASSTIDYVIHENYDQYEILNDIALVKLQKSVPFSDAIRPACLPSEYLGDLEGLNATATGWGHTKYEGEMSPSLQKVQLAIKSFSDCDEMWGKIGLRIKTSQMCAIGPGKDTCSGDSGGPLVVMLEGRWVLVGITSFGYECASPDQPGVYTKVSKFVNWIRKQIDNGNCP